MSNMSREGASPGQGRGWARLLLPSLGGSLGQLCPRGSRPHTLPQPLATPSGAAAPWHLPLAFLRRVYFNSVFILAHFLPHSPPRAALCDLGKPTFSGMCNWQRASPPRPLPRPGWLGPRCLKLEAMWTKQRRRRSGLSTAVRRTRRRQNSEQLFEEAENYRLPAQERLFKQDWLKRQRIGCRPFRLITATPLSIITRSSN